MIMTYRNAWLPEVFNDFFDTENMPKANATAPAINVKETPSEYVVEMAAPGMRKEDFGVHINNDGDLTVKMECKRNEKEEKPCHYLRREFAYSKFEQTLILPVNRLICAALIVSEYNRERAIAIVAMAAQQCISDLV